MSGAALEGVAPLVRFGSVLGRVADDDPAPKGFGPKRRLALLMTHDLHDKISMLVARHVADHLPAHPEWLDIARGNLERWSSVNADTPSLLRCYAEWRAILDRPVEEIRRVYLAETDDGQRLRQNSPFVGILPEDLIREIELRVRREAAAA